MLNTTMTAAEVVERTRQAFRANIPQSNAWIEPSNLSVTASVIGGALWTLMQEARNGIDARVMPETAQGEYLDAIAARPPFNLLRRPATRAEGYVSVDFPGVASLTAGEVLTRTDGVRYRVKCDTPLSGVTTVAVQAMDAGPGANAVSGMPLEDGRGEIMSQGISGGWPVETDDELRDRIYRSATGCVFGSVQSVECLAYDVPGVTDVQACGGDCAGRVGLYVAVGNRAATEADIELVQRHLGDGCKLPAFVCVEVEPATENTLRVSIGVACVDVAAALEKRLIPSRIGATITVADVLAAIAAEYPGETVAVHSVEGNPGPGGFFTSVEVNPA